MVREYVYNISNIILYVNIEFQFSILYFHVRFWILIF
nr:MAG TPA: hypothetical protein [Caudoviricetes sp.]